MFINELEVHSYGGMEIYRVGANLVREITFSAGTSGVEYIIKYSNSTQLQLRGCFNYKATYINA
jgi:hypothetical protein